MGFDCFLARVAEVEAEQFKAGLHITRVYWPKPLEREVWTGEIYGAPFDIGEPSVRLSDGQTITL